MAEQTTRIKAVDSTWRELKRGCWSNYLKQRMPAGFRLYEEGDDFLHLVFGNEVVATFAQGKVTSIQLVEAAEEAEGAAKDSTPGK